MPNLQAGPVDLAAARFSDGLHMCHVFNDDVERVRTLSRYLEAGLGAGERALCLVDGMTGDDVVSTLARAGVEQEVLDQHLGVVAAEAAYCPGGDFVPEECLATFGALAEQSRAAGFSGTRILGDMGWSVRHGISTESLLEYEAKVREYVARFPCTAACEYDARLFDGATILDILAVHPAMIVRGQVVLNPFYSDPADLLARYRARQRLGG